MSDSDRYAALRAGNTSTQVPGLSLTITLARSAGPALRAPNVVGILPGRDPALREARAPPIRP